MYQRVAREGQLQGEMIVYWSIFVMAIFVYSYLLLTIISVIFSGGIYGVAKFKINKASMYSCLLSAVYVLHLVYYAISEHGFHIREISYMAFFSACAIYSGLTCRQIVLITKNGIIPWHALAIMHFPLIKWKNLKHVSCSDGVAEIIVSVPLFGTIRIVLHGNTSECAKIAEGFDLPPV